MTFKKTKIALGIASATLAVAGVLVAPQASANSQAERVADAASKKAAALEAQVNQMADMMQAMQAELNRVKSASASVEKVQELDEWMASVKSNPTGFGSGGNMVFFRGGYARNDHDRSGEILIDANADNSHTAIPTSTLTGNSDSADNDAWYFGAGFDLNLSNDLFGLMDDTNVLGEITINYKEFDSQNLNRAPLGTAANDSVNPAIGAGTALVCGGPNNTAGGTTANGAGPYGNCSAEVTVSQISITASPKIKFMADSDFRPWIIPAGFSINVVSPPSEGVTYIAPGIMFAGGADYKIWNNLYAGVDARYHIIANTMDTVELDGFEAGGYIGFGF